MYPSSLQNRYCCKITSSREFKNSFRELLFWRTRLRKFPLNKGGTTYINIQYYNVFEIIFLATEALYIHVFAYCTLRENNIEKNSCLLIFSFCSFTVRWTNMYSTYCLTKVYKYHWISRLREVISVTTVLRMNNTSLTNSPQIPNKIPKIQQMCLSKLQFIKIWCLYFINIQKYIMLNFRISPQKYHINLTPPPPGIIIFKFQIQWKTQTGFFSVK